MAYIVSEGAGYWCMDCGTASDSPCSKYPGECRSKECHVISIVPGKSRKPPSGSLFDFSSGGHDGRNFVRDG